jgi:hypothetical protein
VYFHNRVSRNVEFSIDRRSLNRRELPEPAVAAALGLVLSPDQRSDDRRRQLRRRGDANSVNDMVSAHDASLVKTFTLAGSRTRKSALYDCGCVVVDPIAATGSLQVLECPAHAALQAKLRRRRTDRL